MGRKMTLEQALKSHGGYLDVLSGGPNLWLGVTEERAMEIGVSMDELVLYPELAKGKKEPKRAKTTPLTNGAVDDAIREHFKGAKAPPPPKYGFKSLILNGYLGALTGAIVKGLGVPTMSCNIVKDIRADRTLTHVELSPKFMPDFATRELMERPDMDRPGGTLGRCNMEMLIEECDRLFRWRAEHGQAHTSYQLVARAFKNLLGVYPYDVQLVDEVEKKRLCFEPMGGCDNA